MLAVRLTPRGGRDAIDGIEQLSDGRRVLKVRVRAAASEGEANAALTKLVAKTLGVPSRECQPGGRRQRAIEADTRCRGGRNICRDAGENLRHRVIRFIRSRPRGTAAHARSEDGRASSSLADSAMTAKIIDGKGIAANLRGKVADAVHRLGARPRDHAGARGRARWQQSGERELCRQQDEDDHRKRHAVVRSPAAGDDERSRAAGADRAPQRRSHGPRHPGAASVARTDRPAKHHRRDRSGKGRRRLPSGECRTPVRGPAGAGALHADRVRASRQDRAAFARRARGGRDRPFQHRRQAAGAAPAGGERDGDGGALQDARSAGGLPPRRSCCSRRSDARKWCGAIGSSPAPS